MPQIGDTKSARELGLGGRALMFYDACPKCGVPRWVRRNAVGHLCIGCVGQLRKENYQGNLSVRWKGGIVNRQDGYRYVVITPDNPYYPMAVSHNRVLEHRLVMAQHLGRCLDSWEVVHHKNNIRNDNRIENLELVTSHKNMAYSRRDKKIEELERRIVALEKYYGLLLWQTFQYANPVLNGEMNAEMCRDYRGRTPSFGVMR